MFLYALIIYQVILTSGKILNFPSNGNLDMDNGIMVTNTPKTTLTHFEEWDDTLWVLKLNDVGLNLTILQSANESEEEYFDDEIGPLIHRHPLAYLSYKRRQNTKRVKKDDPKKSYPADHAFKDEPTNTQDTKYDGINNEVKYRVIQMINKFVLSFQKQPDSNLPETMDAYITPSLNLYFKGPFTALTVNYQRMVWQFFIQPPSPLPEWFYNEHSNITLGKNGMYVTIPDAIKEEFYEKLLHLLEKLFNYPM
ncbi:uncharacterized protein LOC106718737 [Papilio machaon]|uniref:uncharacterized protein LOC106718737 n=1 Tax=Papilio machaon TaxID=76193 RepID=UPI001E6646E1|nr:uncharacterized protein LOC106718737 [Papilio machaon]